jgi:heme exporter protein D
MRWTSFADFLAMGGYGLYVWGSFGVTAALMALELVLLRQRRRRALDAVRNWRLLQAADGDAHDPSR